MDLQTRKGFINVTVGATLWGINGVFASFLFSQKGITSDWLTPYRLLIAGGLLLGYLYMKEGNKVFDILRKGRDLFAIIIFAVFGMLGTQYTYFTTIQHSNAGIATVLQYLCPAIILVYVCFRETRLPKYYEIIALSLSLLGVFVLATHGDIDTLQVSSLALFWGVLSAITAVIYTVQPARLLRDYGTPVVIAWGMLIGGVVLSVGVRPWEQPVEVDATVIVFLLLIVLLGSIFSFIFYLSGVNVIGPAKASMIACIEPVIATVCSVVFLGSSFAFLDFIGFILILSTVFIVAYFGGEKQKRED